MASEKELSELQRFKEAHDRLYTITKQVHDTFAHGHTSIKQGVFEELLQASLAMLTEGNVIIAMMSPEEEPEIVQAKKTPARKAVKKRQRKKWTMRLRMLRRSR